MNARFAQRTVRWVMMIGSPLVRGAWIETARMTARWLDRINPDEETLAVVRPGLAGVLRRTLATSHPIESALAVTRRVTARVTRWRDGEMRRRWCVAGLLRAKSLPPGQGTSGPPDAHQGPGGIDPSTTVWNRARRRVRMAGGTTYTHDNGWDRVAPGDGAPDLSSFPGSRPCPTHPTRTPRGPISPPRPASASPPAPDAPAVTASSRRRSGVVRARSTAPTT